MKISQLYHYYHLPPNLRQHIYWVTAVGKHIIDNWTGPKIDKNIIIQTLLLHDLGNLAKYDFSKNSTLLDSSLDKKYWLAVQEELARRYGSRSSGATSKMLKELKINKKIIKLVRSMRASKLQEVYKSSLELQICEYADMRVTPWGVSSLKERLQDIKKRYKKMDSVWAKDELFESNNKFGEKIEQRLQKHTATNILSIPKPDLDHYLVELPQYQIKIPLWTSFVFRIKHFVKPLSQSRK